jgi:hypothetical protein
MKSSTIALGKRSRSCAVLTPPVVATTRCSVSPSASVPMISKTRATTKVILAAAKDAA